MRGPNRARPESGRTRLRRSGAVATAVRLRRGGRESPALSAHGSGMGRARVGVPLRSGTILSREVPMPTTTQQTSVLERFLRYVKLDTTSDPDSPTLPSTSKQLMLLDLLVSELKGLGLRDAERDRFGIVMATLTSTSTNYKAPTIGFLAHVDTSPGTRSWVP